MKDLMALFLAGLFIYEALTGRVSGRYGGVYKRKEYPVYFWLVTPIRISIAAFLLVLVFHDLLNRKLAADPASGVHWYWTGTCPCS